MKARYSLLGIAVLRVPLLSVDLFDRVKTVADLRSLLKIPLLQRAICFSNPSFHGLLLEWLRSSDRLDPKDEKRIVTTAYKYLARACHRPTPYGLFGAVAFPCIQQDRIGDRRIVIPRQRELHTSLDSRVLYDLSRRFRSHRTLLRSMTFTSNNSIHSVDGHIHYYDRSLAPSGVFAYSISRVTTTSFLVELLTFSRKPRTWGELLVLLRKLTGVGEEDAEQFIEELVRENLLTCEIDGCFLSGDGLETLIRVMARSGVEEDVLEPLRVIDSHIRSVGSMDVEFFHKELRGRLGQVGVTVNEGASMIHMDTTLARAGVSTITLSTGLVDQLYETRDILASIHRWENPMLLAFSKEFGQRYLDRAVPLLEALDPLRGIGYHSKHEQHCIPGTRGLRSFMTDSRSGLNLSPLDVALARWLAQWETDRSFDLADRIGDLPFLEGHPTPSCMAMISMVGDGTQVFLREFSEISASRFLNRFAYLSPELKKVLDEVDTIDRNFLRADRDIVADFFHVPEVRMANLLKYDRSSRDQCPSTHTDATSREHLALNDLMLRCIHGRMHLFHRVTGQRIVLRSLNSLNPRAFPLDVHSFIHDLQGANFNFDLGFSWGGLLSLFKEFPRVVFKNVILHPRMWIVTDDELGSPTDVPRLLEQRRIPRLMQISASPSSDEILYIDVDCEPALGAFIQELKKHKRLFVREILDRTFVSDPDGSSYNHEIMLPIVNPVAPEDAEGHRMANSVSPQRHFPGSEWLYLKVYCDPNLMDKVLVSQIAPVLWPDDDVQRRLDWYFVRYKDDMHHLRIRVRVKDEGHAFNIYRELRSSLQELISADLIQKLTLDTYERELDRYGWELTSFCEDVMCNDSRLVSRIIAGPDLDRFHDAVLGVDMYMDLFGLSTVEKKGVTKRLADGYFKEHRGTAALRVHLDMEYRQNSKLIKELLEGTSNTLSHAVRYADEVHSLSRSIGSLLREMEGVDLKRDILMSLIHMHLNRLFSTNARLSEMYVYGLLGRYYDQLLARGRKASNAI